MKNIDKNQDKAAEQPKQQKQLNVDSVQTKQEDAGNAPITGEVTKAESDDTIIKPNPALAVTGAGASELQSHEALSLKMINQLLDSYETPFTSVNPNLEASNVAADSLHAAVREFVTSTPEVQKVVFSSLIQRIVNKEGDVAKKNAYAMPRLMVGLGDDSRIESNTERRFIAEFLTITRRFALTENKADFTSTHPIERVLGVITDDKQRNTILALFGK